MKTDQQWNRCQSLALVQFGSGPVKTSRLNTLWSNTMKPTREEYQSANSRKQLKKTTTDFLQIQILPPSRYLIKSDTWDSVQSDFDPAVRINVKQCCCCCCMCGLNPEYEKQLHSQSIPLTKIKSSRFTVSNKKQTTVQTGDQQFICTHAGQALND